MPHVSCLTLTARLQGWHAVTLTLYLSPLGPGQGKQLLQVLPLGLTKCLAHTDPDSQAGAFNHHPVLGSTK